MLSMEFSLFHRGKILPMVKLCGHWETIFQYYYIKVIYKVYLNIYLYFVHHGYIRFNHMVIIFQAF